MKISTLWLREWVNFPSTEQELANELTMVGLEVDGINPVAGEFNKVIVAEVISTKPHPDANKLTICEVNANSGSSLQIVCGAANVRPGLKVALAMIGAQLPGGMQIKESKLRGELSQGMLCSASELGLVEHSEGIMELEQEAPIGVDLREYLALNDHILEIDLTPNRADCFSVLGIAREVAALKKIPLLIKDQETITPSIDDKLSVSLSAAEACPRYCGRVIREINPNAVTPLWMAERLRRGGIRTLHPVVDVMNYVMLELGQPMHSFDLAAIKDSVEVRMGRVGESLELLDGQTIELQEKVLVIADREKPLAMAGVMGGAASAVQAHTRDVFLESAFFSPLAIAGVARAYGLFSDSSQRYERGVDPLLQLKALERATSLILSIAGGKAGPVIEANEKNYLPAPIQFPFDTRKIERLTGIAIPLEEISGLLEGLGIKITHTEQNLMQVAIPSYRFDIQQAVDLVEEVIRLHGYDKLKAKPMTVVVQPGSIAPNECITEQVALWFKGRGYSETISYSFVDPALQETLYPHREFMQLLNPISSELSQMRVGLWSGLIASMMHNVHRQHNTIKLFEMGVIFDVQHSKLTERSAIAGLLMGEYNKPNWSQPAHPFDFFDLKGDLESLFATLKINQVEFIPTENEALHPGKSAKILINGVASGWVGALHPRLQNELELRDEVFLFELATQALINPEISRYKAVSKYPQIRRDLSFLVNEEVNAQAIEAAVRASIKEAWLKEFTIFDVYMGKGIPEGKKSIAIALILQDATRTLIDNEINLLIDAIIKTLEDEFAIILRD
jgi:phenylalanyl-tRNA synthetase beta chain